MIFWILTSYTLFKDLKTRPESIKHDVGLGSDILNMTAKALATKAIIDKRDYIKLKFPHSNRNNQQSEKVACCMTEVFLRVLGFSDPHFIIKNT